jgi:hypothetical protein
MAIFPELFGQMNEKIEVWHEIHWNKPRKNIGIKCE